MKNLIIIIYLFISVMNYAQTNPSKEANTMVIKGITTDMKVYEHTSRINDVSIHIYEYNTKITTYCTDENGKFEFTIPTNSYIVVEFQKENFISKRVLFDTRTDAKMKKIKPFNLEIVMINYKKGVEYGDLDFPITRVEYQEEYKDFNYVKEYTDRMMKKQKRVLTKLAGK